MKVWQVLFDYPWDPKGLNCALVPLRIGSRSSRGESKCVYLNGGSLPAVNNLCFWEREKVNAVKN